MYIFHATINSVLYTLIGRLSATFQDRDDPDLLNEADNVGYFERLKLYCIAGEGPKKARVIPLQGGLTTSISGQG